MAAPALVTLQQLDHFSRIQAFYSHKFHYYRNGLPGHQVGYQDILDGFNNGDPGLSDRYNDIVIREASLPNGPAFGLPLLGPFRFSRHHRIRLRNVAVASRAPLRTLPPQPRGPVDRHSRQALTAEYSRFYDSARATFRYFRCLGWGGEGITSLWRYTPGPGQQSHMVVMKMSRMSKMDRPPGSVPRPVIDTEFIDQERDMMTLLKRAPHIVQRFYTGHHPRNVAPGSRRSARAAQDVATMTQTIDSSYGSSHVLMEQCKFGNLESHLFRAARDGPNGMENYFPEIVIWHFFDCLVKGAMAMEEPPMQNTVTVAQPANIQGDFLPEQITPGNQGRQGLVHMDLSSSTAMTPQLCPRLSSQGIQPFHAYRQVIFSVFSDAWRTQKRNTLTKISLQIADFGMAMNEATVFQHARHPAWGPPYQPHPSTAAEFDRRGARWDTRNLGKWLNSLPEQFGKDWDLVPQYEDPSDTHSPANWAPHWIPPWAPPPPITTGPARYSAASNVWHIGMIIKVCMTLLDPDFPPYAGRMRSAEPPNPTLDEQRWTYGWSLLDPTEGWQNRYSQALLDLVAQCLMARQRHRPDLATIQQTIDQELLALAATPVPGYFVNTFFREPPRPRPPLNTANIDNIDPFWDYARGVSLI